MANLVVALKPASGLLLPCHGPEDRPKQFDQSVADDVHDV